MLPSCLPSVAFLCFADFPVAATGVFPRHSGHSSANWPDSAVPDCREYTGNPRRLRPHNRNGRQSYEFFCEFSSNLWEDFRQPALPAH